MRGANGQLKVEKTRMVAMEKEKFDMLLNAVRGAKLSRSDRSEVDSVEVGHCGMVEDEVLGSCNEGKNCGGGAADMRIQRVRK